MTKPTTVLATLLAVTLGAGCFSERSTGPDDATPCTSSGTDDCVVVMSDNAFAPATLRITAGSTVTWRNQGASPHTSTSGDWDSGTLMPGAEFGHAFPAAGTFDYECVFHAGMEGTVVVE